jgi:hypothetical protein
VSVGYGLTVGKIGFKDQQAAAVYGNAYEACRWSVLYLAIDYWSSR